MQNQEETEFGDILNLEEASDFLQVSRQLLVKEITDSGLPARKVGREWRFSKRALIEWVENPPN